MPPNNTSIKEQQAGVSPRYKHSPKDYIVRTLLEDMRQGSSASRPRKEGGFQKHEVPLSVFDDAAGSCLFLRDLPFHFTDDVLRQFIVETLGGDTSAVHTVNVGKNKQDRTLHFAYVRFSSEERANSALTLLNGLRVDGRDLRAMVYNRQSNYESSQNCAVQFSFRTDSATQRVTEATVREILESLFAPHKLEHICLRKYNRYEPNKQSGSGFFSFVDKSIDKRAVDELKRKNIGSLELDCNWSSTAISQSSASQTRDVVTPVDDVVFSETDVSTSSPRREALRVRSPTESNHTGRRNQEPSLRQRSRRSGRALAAPTDFGATIDEAAPAFTDARQESTSPAAYLLGNSQVFYSVNPPAEDNVPMPYQHQQQYPHQYQDSHHIPPPSVNWQTPYWYPYPLNVFPNGPSYHPPIAVSPHTSAAASNGQSAEYIHQVYYYHMPIQPSYSNSHSHHLPDAAPPSPFQSDANSPAPSMPISTPFVHGTMMVPPSYQSSHGSSVDAANQTHRHHHAASAPSPPASIHVYHHHHHVPAGSSLYPRPMMVPMMHSPGSTMASGPPLSLSIPPQPPLPQYSTRSSFHPVQTPLLPSANQHSMQQRSFRVPAAVDVGTTGEGLLSSSSSASSFSPTMLHLTGRSMDAHAMESTSHHHTTTPSASASAPLPTASSAPFPASR